MNYLLDYFFHILFSFGVSLELLNSLLFVSLSIIVIVSDLRYMIIPNEFIIIPYILLLIIKFILNGFDDIFMIVLDSLSPFYSYIL